MYKIAILEDDAAYAELLSKKISTCFSNTKEYIHIEIFLTAKGLLTNTTIFDIYFLDILLSDGNGMDIANKIRQKNDSLPIIFVSSLDDAVYEAIHYAPLRFIRKENLDSELPEACKAIVNATNKNSLKEQKTSSLIKILPPLLFL